MLATIMFYCTVHEKWMVITSFAVSVKHPPTLLSPAGAVNVLPTRKIYAYIRSTYAINYLSMYVLFFQ